MGFSRQLKDKIESFSKDDLDRLVRMGWEDRTTFEDIQQQFGLTPNDFVKVMRSQLPASAFQRWRKRVHLQGRLKNKEKRGFKTTRFKCTRQTVDGITKGWK